MPKIEKIRHIVEANEPNLTTNSPFSELNTAKAELEKLAKEFLETFNWLNTALNDDGYSLENREEAITSTLTDLAKEVNNIVDNKILEAIKTASVKANEKINELKAQRKEKEKPLLRSRFASKDDSTEPVIPVQSELDKLETEFSDFI